MPQIELWIDDAPSRVMKPAYMDKLVELGVGGIAVMVDTTAKGWDPKWSASNLEKLRKLAVEDRDIEIILTTWPDPVKDYIKKMATGMLSLLEAAGAAAWEIDTEFNWKPTRVHGFRSTRGTNPLDLAGDYLVESMSEVADALSVRLELTTFTSHTENGRAADVAPHMDLLLPQAYSVRSRNKTKIDWGHIYGPGNMQKMTLDRTMLVKGVPRRPRLGCGLAAYDQVWPGKTAKEAMRVAYQAAVGYGCERIRYWSSKWVLGARDNGYAKAFLKSL